MHSLAVFSMCSLPLEVHSRKFSQIPPASRKSNGILNCKLSQVDSFEQCRFFWLVNWTFNNFHSVLPLIRGILARSSDLIVQSFLSQDCLKAASLKLATLVVLDKTNSVYQWTPFRRKCGIYIWSHFHLSHTYLHVGKGCFDRDLRLRMNGFKINFCNICLSQMKHKPQILRNFKYCGQDTWLEPMHQPLRWAG